MKTLKVAFRGVVANKKTYEVIITKNTTDYDPGQTMTEVEVAALCNNPCWDVIILGAKREG
jgi:hypothetical protein